jgi:hypothetical protein
LTDKDAAFFKLLENPAQPRWVLAFQAASTAVLVWSARLIATSQLYRRTVDVQMQLESIK